MKPSLTSYFFALVRELSGQCHSLVPALSLFSLKNIESVIDVRGPSIVEPDGTDPDCLPRIRKDSTPITVLGHPTELDKLDTLIAKRNALCKRIMEKDGIPVDDLHKVMIHRLNLASGDRFHWNHEGFEVLADAVMKSILPFLQSTPKSK